MIVYLDEYRKARLIGDRHPETPDGTDRAATALVSNVFQFRHPCKMHTGPGRAGLVQADIEEDLDRIYALASQS